MLRISTHLFLLLVVVAADGAVDHLKHACSQTPHPELCVTVLSTVPESRAADARGLALLATRAAAKMAAAAKAVADAEWRHAEGVNRHEDNSCTPAAKAQLCFSFCGAGFEVAEWMLEAKDAGAGDDASRFATARLYFQLCRATEYRSWNCGKCQFAGYARGVPGVLSKGSDTERFMEVTAKLVARAPGGTAPLPPLPDKVYVFLNRMDFEYVHLPDDCRESEPREVSSPRPLAPPDYLYRQLL